LSEAVRDLADRLDRLARTSDDGRFSWSRLLGRLVGTTKRPKVQTEVLKRLLDRIEFGYTAQLHPTRGDQTTRNVQMAALRSQAENIEPALELYAAAVREMSSNLARAERTAFVHGRLPDGHLDRLWRLYQVVYRAAAWVNDVEQRPILRS